MNIKKRVLRSINNEDESRCVDLFLRCDNTFGFEEYRRDIEDNQGWFAIGFFDTQIFNGEKQALDAALLNVSWLGGAIADGQGGPIIAKTP